MVPSFKWALAFLCAYSLLAQTLTAGKKVALMETFTFDVFKDIQAINIQDLKTVGFLDRMASMLPFLLPLQLLLLDAAAPCCCCCCYHYSTRSE